MSPPNPYAPIGVTVPRAVQQLRAQCLDPDVILMARRGMTIKAVSPQDLWRIYTVVTRRIDQEIHSRLRKLPWLFQSIGTLFGEEFIEPAVRSLRECLGADLHVQFWPSSREGILRKAMGSEDLLRMVAAGYPDHHTASLGGAVPLYVPLAAVDSPAKVAESIRQAWDAYRVQYSQTTPLRGKGTVHRPAVILLGGLGAATATAHADEARPVFAALIETMVAAEGARAFGGMRAVPSEELLALVNAPLRYPPPLDIPAGLLEEAGESEQGFPDRDNAAEPVAAMQAG
jgi:rhamnose utilization protein RhaD (predicted bifunctional aldolase and dehydrogenase)